jgi:hypothetical protein
VVGVGEAGGRVDGSKRHAWLWIYGIVSLAGSQSAGYLDPRRRFEGSWP